MIPLAILAGGRGRRLGALTRRRPKSLLVTGAAPFIDYQLAWAARQGVKRVVLCLGHLARPIRRHVERNRRGLEIFCSEEGKRPLGTAGALRRALPRLGGRFLVLYGDSYLPVDYAAVARAQAQSGLPALMVIHRNAGRYDRSNVRPRGGRVEAYTPGGGPQMEWIDAGISVLTPGTLRGVRRGQFLDLAEVFARLAARHHLGCLRTRHRFYEVGSRRGLAEFRRLAARLRAQAGW